MWLQQKIKTWLESEVVESYGFLSISINKAFYLLLKVNKKKLFSL